MGLADSDRVPRAPPYSGSYPEFIWFRLQGSHLLWLNFPVVFIYQIFFLLSLYSAKYIGSPTTLYAQQLQFFPYIKFRLLQFRSPLLSESLIYFLFFLLLRCFSSQASPHITIYSLYDTSVLPEVGSPIRIPALHLVSCPLHAVFRRLARPSSAAST